MGNQPFQLTSIFKTKKSNKFILVFLTVLTIILGTAGAIFYYQYIQEKNINNQSIDNIISEKRDGPTPNGGDYSIIYYLDKDGNSTTKKKASSIEIIEFDDKGQEIFRTYGDLK